MVFGVDRKLVPSSEASLPELDESLGGSYKFGKTHNSYGRMVNN